MDLDLKPIPSVCVVPLERPPRQLLPLPVKAALAGMAAVIAWKLVEAIL